MRKENYVLDEEEYLLKIMVEVFSTNCMSGKRLLIFVFNYGYVNLQQQGTEKFLRKQWKNLRNPIEVGKERTSACSQKRSGPIEAKREKRC